MKRFLLIASIASIASLIAAPGCSKTRVTECDDLVSLAEKIENCEKIPPENRKSITGGIDQIRKALKMLEDVGDQAPKEQLEALGRTCKMQSDRIRGMYEKVAPECLK
jgi:hypothetical protein